MKRLYFRTLATALLMVLPAGSALAQEQTSLQFEEEKLTLSLDRASILDLVRWASDATDKSIIVHPSVQGQVTVVAGAPMTRAEAYQVFLSILQVHGLALVDDGSALMVVPGSEAKTSPLPVTEEDTFSLDQDMVVHILSVENASAQNIVSLLRPLMPQTGYLAAYPSTNTLLIADTTRNINKLLDIVAQIDRSESLLDIELIPVKYASAREINSIITTLMPNNNEAGVTLQMAVDERSNSILMTGDPVTREQIKKLIARLDAPLDGSGNTQVIRVQYVSAEDIVSILENAAKSLQREVRDQSLDNIEISIQAQSQLNAIIVTAPPSILSVVRGIIAELDVPRSQVLVEALIVDLSQDLANDIGIEWQSAPVSGSEGVVGGFSLYPSSLAPLTPLEDGGFELGTGLSIGYYRGNEIRALVNALAGESNANILSTPTILALDNEEAMILVGSSVPFITGTENREGDNPFQTIERQDIGITLKVKPRVNNDNSVTLEINQSVENIGQSAVTTADIITNKREISTKVLIPNNQTLVLGGLMQDEASETESKVPLLGDIPILGQAFKSTSTTLSKTNLMVFIHPRIINTNTQLIDVSNEFYDETLDMQDGFRQSLDPADRFWIMRDTPRLPDRLEIEEQQIEQQPEAVSE